MYDPEYGERVDAVRGWLAGIGNLQQVGRNGLHRYNNSDHSMLTAMRAVENLLDGTDHDIWAVNAESVYHETARRGREPLPQRPRDARRCASRSPRRAPPERARRTGNRPSGRLSDGRVGAAGGTLMDVWRASRTGPEGPNPGMGRGRIRGEAVGRRGGSRHRLSLLTDACPDDAHAGRAGRRRARGRVTRTRTRRSAARARARSRRSRVRLGVIRTTARAGPRPGRRAGRGSRARAASRCTRARRGAAAGSRPAALGARRADAQPAAARPPGAAPPGAGRARHGRAAGRAR